MKKLLTLLAMIITTGVYAQTTMDRALDRYPLNKETERVVFERIVNSTLDKNTQYLNVKKWIAVNYNDYKSVVKMEDQPGGILVLKGVSILSDDPTFMTEKMQYTIELTVKDKKTRIRIYDLSIDTHFIDINPKDKNEPLEDYIKRNRSRKDVYREDGAKSVAANYNIIENLITNLSSAIVIKDNF